ncbi:MAG: hypothetical protein Q8T08_12680, partial [Ignavibacteria bacterium]|nr:hypothetical protein [Ignavibacteria bacterium]
MNYPFQKTDSASFHRIIIILAAGVFLLTAYFSKGYFHADEHYQIIEFAGLKLGTHTTSELAWEYKEASRQAIQPMMCYAIFSVLKLFGLTNPYVQAFVLRLITALLALFAISRLVTTTLQQINPNFKKAFIILSYFLWFIPAINIRFSSETWSGLMLVLLISVLFKTYNSPRKNTFLMGVLMGFAFLFRFQSAFFSLGIIIWLISIERLKIKQLLILFAGGILVLLLGLGIDSWFYGKLVFTPWTYFSKQILDGMAAGFGESPWYFYLKAVLFAPGLPLGILIYSAFFILIIRQPKSPTLWGFLLFILMHTFVAHKETRFLFPLVNFLPLMLVLAWQEVNNLIPNLKKNNKLQVVVYSIFALLFVGNTIAMATMSVKPAGNGKMEITSYIAENYPDKRIQLIHADWSSPYNPWESVPTKFYQRENISETRIRNLC